MEIFEFLFMRKAFFVGILLAVIIPCIGVVVVFRRLSMIGDALSHTSLAGVAAGLIGGFNPVAGAAAACTCAAFGIEAIRRKFPRYAELSIAIVMSAGVGLAGVLSGLAPNASGFNNFLFGSIVAITDTELLLVTGVAVAVAVVFLLLYKELLYLSFDEPGARVSGVPADLVNSLFTLLTAFTVSIAARTVGALMVSSLMVVPVACAMQSAKSYLQTVCHAVLYSVVSMTAGLFLAYYGGLKPGGTVVLCGIVLLLLLLGGKWALKKLRAKRAEKTPGESAA